MDWIRNCARVPFIADKSCRGCYHFHQCFLAQERPHFRKASEQLAQLLMLDLVSCSPRITHRYTKREKRVNVGMPLLSHPLRLLIGQYSDHQQAPRKYFPYSLDNVLRNDASILILGLEANQCYLGLYHTSTLYMQRFQLWSIAPDLKWINISPIYLVSGVTLVCSYILWSRGLPNCQSLIVRRGRWSTGSALKLILFG